MLRRLSPAFVTAAAAALLATAGFALAQAGKGGGKGAGRAEAADSSGSFEVSGIEVDVRGKDAESARMDGWRLAQRKGWTMLAQRLAGRASTLGDSALDGMVTGIVVEREHIGPNRYVAKLGVLFDRNRAASALGVANQMTRSPPMLLVPVQVSGGVHRVFEGNSAFVEGWKRFRTGNSAIDYVRPAGSGPDRLLMNAGQVARRGRGWWRTILDQYGAEDVLVPSVELRRSYPGGPIVGVFTAGHGPDNVRIAQFVLRVNDGNALPALIDAGIQRIDKAYQDAMRSGRLRTDRLLVTEPPRPEVPLEETGEEVPLEPTDMPMASATTTGTALTVQFDTPGVAALNSGEAAVRGVPGVSSAATTSMALGGVSVMRVTYQGSQASLRAALQARGWQVEDGPGVLRIRRGGGSPTPAPAPATPTPAPEATGAGTSSDG